MDPSSSSTSFTSLMNSSTSIPGSAGPQNDYNQQYFPPPHFPRNAPAPPPYAHNFIPFGPQPGYHQSSSSYHGFPYQGSVGQYQQGSSGVGMAGDESGSPLSIPQPVQASPAIDEESESSPEEGKKKSGRKYWSEEENLRLVSAWLNNSNDPIKGNEKKIDHYWKEVTREYNKYSPKDRRRSVPQCKSHWNKYAPRVTKFNSCWHRMKSAHASGESDEQILERAHAVYKEENSQKPFLFEYWWRVIKDQPKWARIYPLEKKRQKVNASGAYTSSSNQETDETSAAMNRHPPGRNISKERVKGKGKLASQSADRLTNETVQFFNDFHIKKSEAIEKMASATNEHAKAIADQNKVDQMGKYIQLMTIDTTNFSAAEKARHEKVVNYFTMELFPGDES